MTVARLLIIMATVFVGLVGFQNCSQAKKTAALIDAGVATDASSIDLDGTYSVKTWTCRQKDILSTLSYSGVTAVQFVIASTGTSTGSSAGSTAGATATQKVSFGTQCASSQAMPLMYSGLNALSVTQAAVTCGSTCTATQCKAVSAPTSPASMTFSYLKSVDAKTISLSHTLTSYDVTNTAWAYGTVGCGVGNIVDLILSK